MQLSTISSFSLAFFAQKAKTSAQKRLKKCGISFPVQPQRFWSSFQCSGVVLVKVSLKKRKSLHKKAQKCEVSYPIELQRFGSKFSMFQCCFGENFTQKAKTSAQKRLKNEESPFLIACNVLNQSISVLGLVWWKFHPIRENFCIKKA